MMAGYRQIPDLVAWMEIILHRVQSTLLLVGNIRNTALSSYAGRPCMSVARPEVGVHSLSQRPGFWSQERQVSARNQSFSRT
jgi:hypothetical protein